MDMIIKAVVAILNVFLDRNTSAFAVNIEQFRIMRKMVNSLFDMIEPQKVDSVLTPRQIRLALNLYKIEGKLRAVKYVKETSSLSLMEAKKFVEELEESFPEIYNKKDDSNQE
jgi:ribosomal protein L7/L12